MNQTCTAFSAILQSQLNLTVQELEQFFGTVLHVVIWSSNHPNVLEPQ